jgi:hypothetical protein
MYDKNSHQFFFFFVNSNAHYFAEYILLSMWLQKKKEQTNKMLQDGKYEWYGSDMMVLFQETSITWRFNTSNTQTHHWTLPSPSCTYLTSFLMLPSHCLPNFQTSFSTKTLYLILLISFIAICQAHHSCLDFTAVTKLGDLHSFFFCQITMNCSSQYLLKETIIVIKNI